MNFRFLTLMCVAVLGLAACSEKAKMDGVDDMGAYTPTDSGMGAVAAPMDGGVTSSIIPGSQEDLTVNIGDRVFFGYDRVDLVPEAKQTLDLQAEWLNRYPNISITVEGHADERGTREYNIALGDRRANAVRSYLISRGVDANRLQTISYGKERPAVFGTDEQSWAQNRRSVTKVN